MPKLEVPEQYVANIKQRSIIRKLFGLISRCALFTKYAAIRSLARLRGAQIHENSIISWRLALKANRNLIVGADTIIETSDIDLRDKVVIGNHVIINKACRIIRLSHDTNSDNMYKTTYYRTLHIDDYVWLATGCNILPQVELVGKGAIVGACSVLTRNAQKLCVYAGNPAKVIGERKYLHNGIVTCSLQGGDFLYYIKTMKRH